MKRQWSGKNRRKGNRLWLGWIIFFFTAGGLFLFLGLSYHVVR